MDNFWREKRVVVTGGAGFLGSYIVEKLKERGARDIVVPRKAQYDLRERAAARQLLDDTHPDLIIHTAATVGGIGANQEHPAEYFYDNLMMGTQLLHESWQAGVPKFVTIGTVCAYPKFAPIPFREESLWDGYPEETNAPYGIAKKALLVQGQAYRQQYGYNSIFLLPVNLYGPRDNFDTRSSHVIPALIRKFVEARERGDDHIVAWGDGSPTREFLYAADCAEGIVCAAEHYEGAEPVNIGSSSEISIRELTELMANLTHFIGEIRWDTSKPNGQPRRKLNVNRAEREFGFRSTTPLIEGLTKTISWYVAKRTSSLSSTF